jgi:AcrR family transcriptional regulator
MLAERKTEARSSRSVREKLLDVALDAILAKGFAATSIEELIAAVGISKSGFFYHFPDKGHLALALLQRYAAEDMALLQQLTGQADAAHADPLDRFLALIDGYVRVVSNLPVSHPGCLAASFVYQDQLFRPELHKLNREVVLRWRQTFRQRLEAAAVVYPTRLPVNLEALADMASGVIEGGLILGRILRDPAILPGQLLVYRQMVESLFRPALRAAA